MRAARGAALLSVGCASEAPPDPRAALELGRAEYWARAQGSSVPGPTVHLRDGAVEGRTDRSAGVDIFWNIPFAAPPVGDLRFAPPAPPARWEGTRRDKLPPRWCPQIHLAGFFLGEEDCLYLNVFRPEGAPADARLPVLVWFYGGAFVLGDSWELGWYDGRHLAASQGVVVVTVNYRVNSLGFLALRSLLGEHGTAGLWGLLDQQQALRWAQGNIALLGGDPTRVMIFGESAGGCSVIGQLALPSSRGLFHAAASESGLPAGDIAWPPLANATVWGEMWAEWAGCPQRGAAQLACLRGKPLKDILNPMLQWRGEFPGAADGTLPALMPFMPWWPAVDGKMLPASPLQQAARGELADVPLILGTNKNEGSIFLPMIPVIVGPDAVYPLTRAGQRRTYAHFFNASTSARVEAMYPPSSAGGLLDPMRVSRATGRVLRDFMFACPGRRVLRLMNSAPRRRRSASYLYHFERGYKGALHVLAGDYHTAEISYVFDNPWLAHVPGIGSWDRADKELAAEMGSYWAGLARGSGSPDPLANVSCTAKACATWPPYAAGTAGRGGDAHMVFAAPLRTGSGLYDAECAMWDDIGYEDLHP